MVNCYAAVKANISFILGKGLRLESWKVFILGVKEYFIKLNKNAFKSGIA